MISRIYKIKNLSILFHKILIILKTLQSVLTINLRSETDENKRFTWNLCIRETRSIPLQPSQIGDESPSPSSDSSRHARHKACTVTLTNRTQCAHTYPPLLACKGGVSSTHLPPALAVACLRRFARA